jgi:ABC-type phosphate transport system substrate-binding protein
VDDTFSRIYLKVHFVLGPPFEGDDAANALHRGCVDIAFVSRELRPVDVAAFRAKYGYAPTSIPVSGGSNRRPGAALPPLVQEFLRFILSREGQQDARREGIYLPLREFQVRSADQIGGLAPSGAK